MFEGKLNCISILLVKNSIATGFSNKEATRVRTKTTGKNYNKDTGDKSIG